MNNSLEKYTWITRERRHQVCIDVGAKGYSHWKGSDTCLFSVFLVISCKIISKDCTNQGEGLLQELIISNLLDAKIAEKLTWELAIQNILGQSNLNSHIWISRTCYIFVETLRNENIVTVERSQSTLLDYLITYNKINKITRSLNIFFCKENKQCYHFSFTIYSAFTFQRHIVCFPNKSKCLRFWWFYLL